MGALFSPCVINHTFQKTKPHATAGSAEAPLGMGDATRGLCRSAGLHKHSAISVSHGIGGVLHQPIKTALEFQALRVSSLAQFVAGALRTKISWQFLVLPSDSPPSTFASRYSPQTLPLFNCKYVHDLALGGSDELLATRRILVVTTRYDSDSVSCGTSGLAQRYNDEM